MDEVSRGFTLMHAHPVKKVSHFGFWALLFLKGVLSGIYQFYFILENILWLCSAKFLKKLWRATNNHFSNRSFFDNKSLLFWTWNAHGLEKKQFLFQGEFLVRIRFFYRPVGQNRRPLVAVNRTGLTGYWSVWVVTGQIQFFFFFCLNSNGRKVY